MNNLTPLPKRRALRCRAAATKIDSSFWENDSLLQSVPASPDLSAFPFLILIPLSTRPPPSPHFVYFSIQMERSFI